MARDSYLLEYRYSGYPSKFFREEYRRGASRFNFGHPKYHYVPHLTLAGPIHAVFERSLIKKIERIVYDHVSNIHKPGNLIHTGKYRHFETPAGKHIIYVEIIPPKALVSLKRELESMADKSWFTKCQTYDEDLWHTTLWLAPAHKPSQVRALKRIWGWARYRKPKEMKFILDRITLIKNGKILREFDLVNKKTLSRIEALDNRARYNSYLKIKEELRTQGEEFLY